MTDFEQSWLRGFGSAANSLVDPLLLDAYSRLGPALDQQTIEVLVREPIVAPWGSGRLAGFLSAWGR